MVAMNPQTWDKDLAEIEPGGYLLYDSSKPMPASQLPRDIHVLGVPLTDLCATRYTDPRERQLLKNIVYVGVLAAMLGVEPEVIATLLGEQYKGKAKLLQPNLDAFMMGLHHGREYFDDALGLRIERRDAVGKRIFIEGNAAAALGCVYGGATVCAWYPITPSSSLAEAFQKYCSKLRVDKATGKNKFAIVQAEDEIASIGIVVGAGWNGARAFTATSGPGRLADDRVHRPGLLRRDPGDDHQRAARRPVHRHADAHPAGRPPRLRLRLARRHQARAAVPRGSARVLRLRRGGARPRRPAADADLRHDRPRHRHEPPPVRAARSGTTRAATTAAR